MNETKSDFQEREKFKEWFHTFIEEKDVPFKSWEIEYNGNIHYIDVDVVVDHIFTSPSSIQKMIKKTLVQIDFRNGDVNHFFHHLAQGLVENY